MKIIFFGSDDFANHHLEHLINSRHQVVACVTQPDKPKGRNLKLEPSMIRLCAEKNKIPVLQPSQIKDGSFCGEIKRYNADLFVVIAYGKILPQDLLDLPKFGAVNVHASLLPKYRGAAPINWAIINGEKETGISIIKMSAALDAGDVLSQVKLKIEEEDTSATLREKMKMEGSKLLLETISNIEGKTASSIKQNANNVSFAPKLTKELGKIDWNKSAVEIHNLVRGLQPWPCAYTFYQNKILKVLSSEISENKGEIRKNGEIIDISPRGIAVQTKQGILVIKTVHPEASKLMDAASFVRGHRLQTGFIFE